MTEFCEAVRQMRHLQNLYFKARNYVNLNNALTAERKVDKMLKEIDEAETQPKIFPNE
jgi:hypothetical protein